MRVDKNQPIPAFENKHLIVRYCWWRAKHAFVPIVAGALILSKASFLINEPMHFYFQGVCDLYHVFFEMRFYAVHRS